MYTPLLYPLYERNTSPIKGVLWLFLAKPYLFN
jgi:hypothetical protein